jgi:pimeloyl-ACP methyl ester carboxylesterase
MPALAVEFGLTDGLMVRGQSWGEGSDWALLVHEPGGDLDGWGDLPGWLLDAGFAVMAIDLPGHGLSDGSWQSGRLAEVLGAARRTITAAGGQRVALIAAGECASTGLRLAATERWAALILLSPVDAGTVTDPTIRAGNQPKLIIVGSLAEESLAASRAIAARCIGWTVTCSIPTVAQGTALLAGDWSRTVREHIAGFLRDCRRPAPRAPRP